MWKYIEGHSGIPHSEWFCQTFLLLLKDLGEWHLVIIGGHPIYMVHMQPAPGGTWTHQRKKTLESFSRMSRKLRKAIHLASESYISETL